MGWLVRTCSSSVCNYYNKKVTVCLYSATRYGELNERIELINNTEFNSAEKKEIIIKIMVVQKYID